jgi:hypothetical protein
LAAAKRPERQAEEERGKELQARIRTQVRALRGGSGPETTTNAGAVDSPALNELQARIKAQLEELQRKKILGPTATNKPAQPIEHEYSAPLRIPLLSELRANDSLAATQREKEYESLHDESDSEQEEIPQRYQLEPDPEPHPYPHPQSPFRAPESPVQNADNEQHQAATPMSDQKARELEARIKRVEFRKFNTY